MAVINNRQIAHNLFNYNSEALEFTFLDASDDIQAGSLRSVHLL